MKRAEHDLRESRKDLQRAQAVAHIGSWRMDVRHNNLIWSEENHHLFGIPVGTPLTYETFLDAVHPDDREYVHEKWSAALRGEPYDIEHRILVSGRVKWLREKAELEFDETGVLRGGFGTSKMSPSENWPQLALLEFNENLEQRIKERTAVAERRAEHLRRMAAELSQTEHRERNRLASILHDDLQQLLLAARLRLAGIGNGDQRLRQEVEAVDELIAECMSASRDLTMELSPPILRRGDIGRVCWSGWGDGLLKNTSCPYQSLP